MYVFVKEYCEICLDLPSLRHATDKFSQVVSVHNNLLQHISLHSLHIVHKNKQEITIQKTTTNN